MGAGIAGRLAADGTTVIVVARNHGRAGKWSGLIDPAQSAETIAATVRARLDSRRYDCVVFGGIRLPPKMLPTCAAIVKAARAGAP